MDKKVEIFLKNKPSRKPKLIVIYWPTACGKTALSIEVAKFLDTEIISTDSRQIYKSMDIGTGKIKESEKQWIIHHMIDIIEPALPYSVWAFQRDAKTFIDWLHSRWKTPILCGWTGLYIDSLVYDFSLPKTPNSETLRKELEDELKEKGSEYMFEKLKRIDPEYDHEIHPNNTKYVLRAIEVKLLTGKSKSKFKEEKKLSYDTLFITPYDGNREKLYARINARVEAMFEEGLVGEVENLIKIPRFIWSLASEWIGYAEVIDYIHQKIPLKEAVNLVQQHSRNYAKRQLTWFRRYEGKVL